MTISLILGRGAYAISLALVSVTCVACKDDPVSVGADASVPGPDATVALDATIGPDAADGPDAGPAPPPPEVCPRPSSTFSSTGDINGDGLVEIADSVAYLDHLFRGGRAPYCAQAADMNGDGLTEADDAARITSYLVTGTQAPRFINARTCASSAPWPLGRCVPLGWQLSAPARVTASTWSAEIAVRSATMAIDAWSMSVSASGCTITAATTDGTTSAEVWDEPPGLRHLGYAALKPVEGGAVAYVTMSHHEDIALPAAERTPLLRVDVTAPVPESGCVPCVLSVDGARKWNSGRPVAAVVVADGRAYVPATVSATVSVCAP